MVAIVLFGLVLKRLVPKLPLMLFLAVLSTVVTIPGAWPLAETTTAVVKQVEFMSLTTTVLALAGFSVARKPPMFRRLGLRTAIGQASCWERGCLYEDISLVAGIAKKKKKQK